MKVTRGLAALGLLLFLAGSVSGQSAFLEENFEAEASRWSGAGVSVDKTVSHGGQASLRVDFDSKGTANSGKLKEKLTLGQKEPEPMMAAVWLRAEAKRTVGKFRGG